MSTYLECRELLSNFVRARIPFVAIRTIEPNRATELIASVAAELRQLSFTIHSRTEGLKSLPDWTLIADDPSLASAIEYATAVFRRADNATMIFTDCEELDEETSTSRHFAELVRLAEARGGAIIVVTDKPVWSGLGRLGMTMSLDLPDASELYPKLKGDIDNARGLVSVAWDDDDVRSASDILAGVTELEARNVIASMLAQGTLTRDDMPKLSEYKDRVFGELAGLERVRMRDDYRVGGLRSLRDWLDKRVELVTADFSQHPTLRPPKGILLVGVPGCGKSLSAKAIAQQWRLPLYRLDMSSILGQYVGQSEGRLKEALETADRVAPCVLWIDEIEKALSTGDDGGTSRRLIGQFLFWLQESTSRVFMVATANDISSLPPELTRKGRFDEIFFVDLPDRQDREEILRMYFTSKLNYDLPPDLLSQLVTASEGFTGAEIDAVVNDIALTQLRTHQSTMYPDHVLLDFFSSTMPFSKSNPEDLATIRTWGAARAVPAGSPDSLVGATGQPSRRIVIT